ncbi:hypothetical protein FHG87_013512 [Trinorchestia longiramus]|nr:hypothetical protein FHG87_013512 [Trinorchestia longiramus]
MYCICGLLTQRRAINKIKEIQRNTMKIVPVLRNIRYERHLQQRELISRTKETRGQLIETYKHLQLCYPRRLFDKRHPAQSFLFGLRWRRNGDIERLSGSSRRLRRIAVAGGIGVSRRLACSTSAGELLLADIPVRPLQLLCCPADWMRTENVKHDALCNPKNVYLPPLHIKLGLMKNFVRGMDNTTPGFMYLKQKFPKISEAKIKEGIFVGPQNRSLMHDEKFEKELTSTVVGEADPGSGTDPVVELYHAGLNITRGLRCRTNASIVEDTSLFEGSENNGCLQSVGFNSYSSSGSCSGSHQSFLNNGYKNICIDVGMHVASVESSEAIKVPKTEQETILTYLYAELVDTDTLPQVTNTNSSLKMVEDDNITCVSSTVTTNANVAANETFQGMTLTNMCQNTDGASVSYANTISFKTMMDLSRGKKECEHSDFIIEVLPNEQQQSAELIDVTREDTDLNVYHDKLSHSSPCSQNLNLNLNNFISNKVHST